MRWQSRSAIRSTRRTSAWQQAAAVRHLTHLNENLASKALAQVQKLPVTSSVDKRPIDAWMVTPPGFDPNRKYPMILEIHGGPYSAYGPSFSTDDQLYAAAGYIVLYTNPRGSTSYGEEFAEPDRQGLSRARL